MLQHDAGLCFLRVSLAAMWKTVFKTAKVQEGRPVASTVARLDRTGKRVLGLFDQSGSDGGAWSALGIL